MHDHATDGILRARAGVTHRALRMHLDVSHDARTSGWDFDALDKLHHKLHADEDARLASLKAAGDFLAGRMAEAPPAVVESLVSCDENSLYLNLKGARERLCEAQTLLPPHHDGGGILARGNLDRAIRLIDTVGAEWCPDHWSRFDQPAEPPTVVDLMEALEESLAKARRTLGVKASGAIPSEAPAGASGPAAVDLLPAPPSSEGVEPCLPRPADRPIPSGVTSSGGAS